MNHLEGCATPDDDHEPPCRDKRGRPRIVLPERKPRGGLIVRSYTRSSGFGKVLDDLNSLMDWKCRVTILGALERPDLLALAATKRDDKRELQGVVDQLLEAGGATQQANRGTAVHSLTEFIDKGLEVGNLPEQIQRDLEAYIFETIRLGIENVQIEAFVVNDELKAAGTFDRLVEAPAFPCPVCGKTRFIGDLKTSSTANYPHSWAIQMAVYSRSQLYDFETYERTPLDVCLDRAILIHLPAGEARCDLYFIDINQGWQAATELVPAMKAWRNNDSLLTPLEGAAA